MREVVPRTQLGHVQDKVRSRFKVSLVGKWETVMGFNVSNNHADGTVTVDASRHISDGAAKYLKD